MAQPARRSDVPGQHHHATVVIPRRIVAFNCTRPFEPSCLELWNAHSGLGSGSLVPTLFTIFEDVGNDGAIRVNAKLVTVPLRKGSSPGPAYSALYSPQCQYRRAACRRTRSIISIRALSGSRTASGFENHLARPTECTAYTDHATLAVWPTFFLVAKPAAWLTAASECVLTRAVLTPFARLDHTWLTWYIRLVAPSRASYGAACTIMSKPKRSEALVQTMLR